MEEPAGSGGKRNWKFERLKAFKGLLAQLVKNPPATQETPVQFLCWEDPVEKEQATHFSGK